MPGNQTPAAAVEQPAFDYVTGVMRGSERRQFSQRLAREPELQAEVNFWEEELMRLSTSQPLLQPAADTWGKIAARVNHQPAQESASWPRWFWQTASALTCMLFVAFVWLSGTRAPEAPNADYVAVLTTEQGAPGLTVLTAVGGEQLWLKWGDIKIAPDKNLQLWAISKTDGQIRPLGVFTATDISQLPLTVPQWRLIKDSSHLLLTEEDVGGSPLDEPSETVLAKGVCVLLAKTEKTI